MTPSGYCLSCRFFVPSTGAFQGDLWGVCSNGAAGRDGELVSWDDGCERYLDQTNPPLFRDRPHAEQTHRRWYPSRVDRMANPADPDHHLVRQCGACRYFILLDGAFIADWGICSNAVSSADGLVRLEHDTCDQFVRNSLGWGGPVPRTSLDRRAREATGGAPDRIDVVLESLASTDPDLAGDAVVVSGFLMESVRHESALEWVESFWPDFDISAPLRDDEERRLLVALYRYMSNPKIGRLRSSVAGSLGESNHPGTKEFLRKELVEEVVGGTPNPSTVHQISHALGALGDRVTTRSSVCYSDFAANVVDAICYLKRLGTPFERMIEDRPPPVSVQTLVAVPEGWSRAGSLSLSFVGEGLFVELQSAQSELDLPPGFAFKQVRAFRQTSYFDSRERLSAGLHLRRRSSWVNELREQGPVGWRYAWDMNHYQLGWSGGLLEVIAEGWETIDRGDLPSLHESL